MGMIQEHYNYCELFFYYYYIVIYNEIIIQLTIMQDQWESLACFPATRWFHLGSRETVTPKVCCLCSVYSRISFWLLSLQKTLLLKDRMLEMEAGFSLLLWQSGYSILTLIQNVWRFEVVSDILLSHRHLRSQAVDPRRFTWLIHKWVTDPFLPSQFRVFCGWGVML